MMLTLNCFYGMVDRRKTLHLNSSLTYSQSFPLLQIFDTSWGFEPALNLSEDFAKWSCAVVTTTTQRRHILAPLWYHLSGIFIANLEQISHIFEQMPTGMVFFDALWKTIKLTCPQFFFLQKSFKRSWDQTG